MTKKRRVGGPHAIDVHVGARLRMLRILAGVSQADLADAVGITFQQVQKYERGLNRVSASRLYQFSQILKTPIVDFFEGLTGTDGASSGDDDAIVAFISSTDGVDLAAAWAAVGQPEVRRQLLQLVRILATPRKARD